MLFRDGELVFFQRGNVASNSLSDVGHCLFFGLPLAQTARQAWTLRHPITVLSPKNNHLSHDSPLLCAPAFIYRNGPSVATILGCQKHALTTPIVLGTSTYIACSTRLTILKDLSRASSNDSRRS